MFFRCRKRREREKWQRCMFEQRKNVIRNGPFVRSERKDKNAKYLGRARETAASPHRCRICRVKNSNRFEKWHDAESRRACTDETHVKNITHRIPFMFGLIDWGVLTDRHAASQFANAHTHTLARLLTCTVTRSNKTIFVCFFSGEHYVLCRGTCTYTSERSQHAEQRLNYILLGSMFVMEIK